MVNLPWKQPGAWPPLTLAVLRQVEVLLYTWKPCSPMVAVVALRMPMSLTSPMAWYVRTTRKMVHLRGRAPLRSVAAG